MAFIETGIFPTAIAYGSTFGSGWATDVAEMESGHEKRNQRWSAPRHKGDVSFGIRTPAQLATVKAMHMVCAGKTHGFRFFDPFDHDDGGAGLVLQDSAGNWRLYKRYSFGSSTYDRPIYKPIAPITLGGGAAGGSLDTASGIVTGIGSSGTWTGQFHCPCRFDIDNLDNISWSQWQIGNIPSIPIIETRDIS